MATMLARHSTASGGGQFVASELGDDRRMLRDLLATRTLKRGDFVLASGKRSRIYFNMKATMMHPQGASLCAKLLFDRIKHMHADFMGGLEMGAVPLLGTVSAYSYDASQPIPAIFVRKKPKEHGTALMIEGLDDQQGESLKDKMVVLVDDVATSGGSVIKAIAEIKAAGGFVTDAIVILDREEGAAIALAEQGISLHSLFKASDLGVTAKDRTPIA